MKNTLNVLYQFNEAYVPFAGTSMTSLFINNTDLQEIHVIVLGEELREESKRTITETVQGFGRTVSFVDTDEIVAAMKKLGIPEYRGSYATNFKLFLTEILDESVEKLLYIDSDTVVAGSLKPLLNFDMQGAPLAMAYDSLGRRHAKLIGLEDSAPYFNAGVILFDLVQWRKLQCTERILHHVQTVRAHYMAPDQDLLNLVMAGQIAVLDLRYDFQPIHESCGVGEYLSLFKPSVYYAAQQIQEAAAAPVIYHFFRFLGEFPWHSNTAHPFKPQFDLYLNQSKWSNYTRAPSDQNGFVFQMERALYRCLPRVLFWPIFRVAYDLFIQRCWKDSGQGKNNDKM